jgi:hypothetical protein
MSGVGAAVLRQRWAGITCLAVIVGLAIGWFYLPEKRPPIDAGLTAVWALASAVLSMDTLRYSANDKLWLVPVNMSLPLLHVSLHPKAPVLLVLAGLLWAGLVVSCHMRRRKAASLCALSCAVLIVLSAVAEHGPELWRRAA